MPKLELLADDNGCDCEWEVEWRTSILNQAMEELRNRIAPETFQIFEKYVIYGQKAGNVADFFDVSIGTVYTIKCRCTEYLREIVKTLEAR